MILYFKTESIYVVPYSFYWFTIVLIKLVENSKNSLVLATKSVSQFIYILYILLYTSANAATLLSV